MRNCVFYVLLIEEVLVSLSYCSSQTNMAGNVKLKIDNIRGKDRVGGEEC